MHVYYNILRETGFISTRCIIDERTAVFNVETVYDLSSGRLLINFNILLLDTRNVLRYDYNNIVGTTDVCTTRRHIISNSFATALCYFENEKCTCPNNVI